MVRLFRHYVPRSLVILAVVEALICLLAILLGRALRLLEWELSLTGVSQALPSALVFTVVMLAIMIAMGLYERNFWNGKADMILRVGVSFLLGLFAMTLIYYMFPSVYLGRGEFGLGFPSAFVGVVLARYGFLHLSDRSILKRRVLVLGAGEKALQIEQLPADLMSSLRVVGYVPLNDETVAVPRTKLLIGATTLYQLTEALRIDELLLAVDGQSPLPIEDILECKISGVQVTDLLTFFERETGKIRLDELQPSSMIFSDGFHQAVLKNTSKRLFDIVAALLSLGVSWPVMVLTALAIWLESGGRGPIFYRQERVGRNDRIFQVIKFRSMRVDAEADGVARWAESNDHRITRVGSFIRPTRIDELPQLLNVLWGHMSFVGPRPERPPFVAQLSRTIPFYSIRHRVNPGITGWAQICYPYGASEEDAREKLQYDLYYIKNYSLFLDLMVLLQTFHVVLWGNGAR